MAASMGQAFAIQTFFIPVLKELPDPKSYWKYVLTAYIIGSSVYVYIGYMGSFGNKLIYLGIVNRPLIVNPPQTVEDYF